MTVEDVGERLIQHLVDSGPEAIDHRRLPELPPRPRRALLRREADRRTSRKEDIEEFITVVPRQRPVDQSNPQLPRLLHGVFGDFAACAKGWGRRRNPCKAVENRRASDEIRHPLPRSGPELDALLAATAGPRSPPEGRGRRRRVRRVRRLRDGERDGVEGDPRREARGRGVDGDLLTALTLTRRGRTTRERGRAGACTSCGDDGHAGRASCSRCRVAGRGLGRAPGPGAVRKLRPRQVRDAEVPSAPRGASPGRTTSPGSSSWLFKTSSYQADEDSLFGAFRTSGRPIDRSSASSASRRRLRRAGAARDPLSTDLRHTFGARMGGCGRSRCAPCQGWMGHRDFRRR